MVARTLFYSIEKCFERRCSSAFDCKQSVFPMVEPERPPDDPDGENLGDDLTDAEAAEFDKSLQSLWNSEENTAPDKYAPPVDHKRLLAFLRRELPADERVEILELLATYRPWRAALEDLMRQRPPERSDDASE
ncbi:MAG: hypothetical protein JSS02_07645 [Planctomycetes bacterium]|nr:hypothetical protein [Planctomycetota bacterium]